MDRKRYVFGEQSSGRPYSRQNLESGHNDNCCVVFEGTKLVFAGETERFTKIKHDSSNPHLALESFMLHNNLRYSDMIDFTESAIEHDQHKNHIFESFYQSGFDESAVLVVDRWGDHDDCITLAFMKEGEEPIIFKRFESSNSPCAMYFDVALAIFGREHSEGKLMGLSGYGKDSNKKYIRWNEVKKSIEVDSLLALKDVEAIKAQSSDVMALKDIAYTVQKNFEDTIVSVIRYFYGILKQNGYCTKNLCMSGGGVLNCPTNSKIVELGLFDNFYATPQPGDGCAESIGRAYRKMIANGENLISKRLKTSYLGVKYPVDELTAGYELLKRPYERICNHLEEGGVIALCHDGAEYGPRALGHRSFLADPSNKKMLTCLNTIKGREWWRPLAPIVPEEIFERIFEVKNTDMCEFMLRTLTVEEKWRSRLAAVCHVDGTTRPQLLKRETNTFLYDLLMTYFERNKIPCLVNTSLNINGFPIVESPRDFCNLIEEVGVIKDKPKVLPIFGEGNDFYEVFAPSVLTS